MVKNPTHKDIMAMPLVKQVMAAEEYRHRARLQEIKQMGASLALLEGEHANIKAAGYTIYADNVSPVFGKRQTLRISTYSAYAEPTLTKALLIAGFTIVERDKGDLRVVQFKKGRLTVQVFMSAQSLEQAEQAIAAASAQAPAPAANVSEAAA
ncbi:hypothetical protein LMG31506_00201 [Cupriavidus yeoncheonensis]|uniref:Uncharacterized protein n=1 Tax=Cupriavidus yeoncheonensis TaxID=1462994 RepID=A0A916IPE7_9BURK|nr:hypothetical protein [Cupriavidus yeoncheonensis]CAG2126845.1 hypothetical protein LMG31506_00201 [Cupriavidus yeoncheonensis]